MDLLEARARAAFRQDLESPPPLSLRGGNDLDSYDLPRPWDPAADQPTDQYLEANHWGVAHLDPVSWRHYLPILIGYALRHRREQGDPVIEALLWSLRPPDRDPPRLGSLTPLQEAVIVELLDALAFLSDSAHQELACQVLEEYWVPGAEYRHTA